MALHPEGAYVLVTTPHQQKLYVPIALSETAGELLERVAYIEGIEANNLALLASQPPYSEFKYNEKLSEQIKPDENVLLSYKTRSSNSTSYTSSPPSNHPTSSPTSKPSGQGVIHIKRIKTNSQPAPIPLTVDYNTDTLLDLKRKVMGIENLPLERIRLVCMGKELAGDNLTLTGLGLQRGATIFVVERQMAREA